MRCTQNIAIFLLLQVVHTKKGEDAPVQCIFVEDWSITFTHSLSSCIWMGIS